MEHEVDVVIHVKIVLDVVTNTTPVLTSVNPPEKSASAAEVKVDVLATPAIQPKLQTDNQAVREELRKAERTTGIPNFRKNKGTSLLAPTVTFKDYGDGAGPFKASSQDPFEERLAEIPSADKLLDEVRKVHDIIGNVRVIKELAAACDAPGGDIVQVPNERRHEFLRRLKELK